LRSGAGGVGGDEKLKIKKDVKKKRRVPK